MSYPLWERREVARHLLWHAHREGGFEPGGFTVALLNAWGRADRANHDRLCLAFPVLGTGVEILKEIGHEGLLGWAELVPVAAQQPDPVPAQ
jgi:hypothetical protein